MKYSVPDIYCSETWGKNRTVV